MIKTQVAFLASLVVGASLARGQLYVARILYPLADYRSTTRQVTQYGAVGSGQVSGSGTNAHALIWSPPNGAVTDLNPTIFGATVSQVAGEFQDQQVGSYSGAPTGLYPHAALWSGSAASAIDLNPGQLGASASLARGTDGTQQVGMGRYGSPSDSTSHALLWSGTAGSAVDLNPTAFVSDADSVALGISGGQEVGDYQTAVTPVHAVLWTGTAASAVDLQPLDPSMEYSVAIATSGNEQVGGARASGGDNQAFLWFGTAASAVNLNPTTLVGITSSFAVATNGQQQVGTGLDALSPAYPDRAMVWSGSAISAVDLNPLLPTTGNWSYSDALSIDPAGNIFGQANGSYEGVTGNFAVEWVNVPETGTISATTIVATLALLRRSRQSNREGRTCGMGQTNSAQGVVDHVVDI